MSDEKKHLTKLDLYERFWMCRDFELTTLWQKAVFLGPILALVFTGYGAFFATCFIDGSEVKFIESGFCVKHVVAMAIAIMGVLFSILWIRMMKGSKAWYEVYERAITAMDTQKDWIFDRELLECGAGFKLHRLPGYKRVGKTDKPQFCDCLFSTKGGCYSPSKINIVIGQISLVFWFLIAGIHLSGYFGVFDSNPDWGAVIAFLVEMVVILVVFLIVFKCLCAVLESKFKRMKSIKLFECRSSSLKERDPGVYSKKGSVKRIYTLRIVDFEGIIEKLINASKTGSTGKALITEIPIENVLLEVVLDKDFERYAEYPCYASFNFKVWCECRGEKPSNEAAEKFYKEEVNPIFDSFVREVSKA